ncbi:MAG: DNA modification methylase [Ruminococcus flavefaciens]|nr:DNA modification methylase [Ruminococcus flavefaciens]
MKILPTPNLAPSKSGGVLFLREYRVQIVYKATEELKPYSRNPRNNDGAVEAVAASIKEFGFKMPIVIDTDGEIIAGHTRIKAAKKLGLAEVPCIIADDLTPDQIKAFRLADNKTAELAEWDFELLQLELEEINLDMTEFGFDTTMPGEPYEDDYEPEPPAEPKTKPGEMFKLGRHTLLCGDATRAADYLKLTGGYAVDLLLTDPPYNVDYEGKTKDKLKIENDKKDDTAFYDFLNTAFENAAEALKPGGVWYIFHADSEGENFRRAARERLGKVRECLIWNKNTIVLGRQDYQWKHEPVLYGWKDGAAHYFVDDRTQATVYEDKGIDLKKLKKDEAIKLLQEIFSDKISTTVINEDKPARSAEHPTMKPIKLLAQFIRNSTHPNEKVLDPFGGSGSTLIACEQLGRVCYTMELDPRYCDVIIDRWEKLTGQKAVKI